MRIPVASDGEVNTAKLFEFDATFYVLDSYVIDFGPDFGKNDEYEPSRARQIKQVV